MPRLSADIHTVTRPTLRASALVYTLVIALLISLVLTGMLLLFQYNRLAQDRLYFEELAQDNLESGFRKVLYGAGGTVSGDFAEALYGSEIDSFAVQSEIWGLWALLNGRGVHGPAQARATVLYGMRPEAEFTTSLFLRDQNRALMLVGGATVTGPAWIPQAGVKRGMVGRMGHTAPFLLRGPSQPSTGHYPAADYSLLQATRERLRHAWDAGISGRESVLPGDSLYVPFTEAVRMLATDRPLDLEHVRLRGHIIVEAPDVVIPATAVLDGVLIFAHTLRVEAGFKGRLQAFVTDSIFVETEAELLYPSALVLAQPENEGWLEMDSAAVLEGMLIHDGDFIRNAQEQPERGGYTLIRHGAEIYGTVLVPWNLDLRGSVHGFVMSQGFLLNTGASLYENYLLDGTLTQEGLSPQYSMGLVQKNPAEYRIAEWLE